jgi:hypothetical protein
LAPRSALARGVLAIVAILPEYAVDVLLAVFAAEFMFLHPHARLILAAVSGVAASGLLAWGARSVPALLRELFRSGS